MAISDKQAAAITRRKQAAAFQQEKEFQDRKTGPLMDFQDTPPVKGQVGWAEPLPGSVKGQGHLCLGCQPAKPSLSAIPITRNLLAARQPCFQCGLPLEQTPEKK